MLWSTERRKGGQGQVSRGESWRLGDQVKKVGVRMATRAGDLEGNEGAPGAGRGALGVVDMVVMVQAEQVWGTSPSNSGRTGESPGVRLATMAAASPSQMARR